METLVTVRNMTSQVIPFRAPGHSIDGSVVQHPLQFQFAPGVNKAVPVEVLLRAFELPIWRIYFGAGDAKNIAKMDLVTEDSDVMAFVARHRPGAPGLSGAMEAPLKWHSASKMSELRAAMDSRDIDSSKVASRADAITILEDHDTRPAAPAKRLPSPATPPTPAKRNKTGA